MSIFTMNIHCKSVQINKCVCINTEQSILETCKKNLLSMRNISKWICEGSKTMVMGSNPAYGQGHLYNTVKKEEEVVPRNRGEE